MAAPLQPHSTARTRRHWWGLLIILCFALGALHLASAAQLSVGKKSLLFIRIDFPDAPEEPGMQTQTAEVMRRVEDYFRTASEGKLDVETTYTPALRLPRPAAWYEAHHAERDNGARAAARAAGFDPARFDLEIVAYDRRAGGGGVGIWRGKGLVSNLPPGFGGIVHELGHNFGLPHNAVWRAWDWSVLGAGMAMTYGDPYDPMGANDDARIHFSARSKLLLGWWGPGDVLNVTQSGTYPIYAEDSPHAPGPRGLRIESNPTNVYWVEFRQLITENPFLMNGVRILKCHPDDSGRVDMTLSVLDMGHGTAHGSTNASLLLGRTLSDYQAGIHITPVARKGTMPEAFDIVVNLGRYTNNHPPVLRLTASPRTPAAGEMVTFRAIATDPDKDPLQYSWDFGDGTFDWAKPVVTHQWKETDHEFAVRCSVTDMKGGSINKLLLVSAGHPTLHHVAGSLTSRGKPLADVLVIADNTNKVFTDSDGLFVLTGLQTGRHRISARTWGCWVAPVRIDCPGTENIRLTTVPLQPDNVWNEPGFEVEGNEVLSTPASFRPPVEITIIAKTSATNLRMAYAADQVIFNWEANGSELRVDGGPANGQHRPGMGAIPANQFVSIRWVVMPTSQAIFVNGELRFRHSGDYSQINRPISVFTYQSSLTVKSIRVKPISTGT